MNMIKRSWRVNHVINCCRIHYISPPKLPSNSYSEDSLLPRLLAVIHQQRGISNENAHRDLQRFGAYYKMLNNLASKCELYPPRLSRLDGWGGKMDEVTTCEAWKELHNIASKEGLVAIGHHHSSELKEVWQATKLMLFSAVSGMVSCPLAMTDGAATTLTKLLQQHQHCSPEECSICSDEWKHVISTTVSNLISRDPEKFWTSGQWMTERAGGSDVTASTETVASQDDEGVIRLYGNKFYTSAIDCDVSLVLARYKGNLSLFLVHLPIEYDGTVQVERLKDKLGTRQLPTAELTLNGLPGLLLADRGIANIIPMLQVTRLYNAISSTSYLRHVSYLAQSFARNRSAFGARLNQLPLHKASLAKLETAYRALAVQSVDLALILNAKDKDLLKNVSRVLSAVVKMHTALVAVSATREGLETFGGAGYMEDTGLPVLFRDACVLPVWEGTTDVLASETTRALSRDSARSEVVGYIRELAAGRRGFGGYLKEEEVVAECGKLESAVGDLNNYLLCLEGTMERECVYSGRCVALGLGAAHAGAALIALARHTRDESDVSAARMWCKNSLPSLSHADPADIDSILHL